MTSLKLLQQQAREEFEFFHHPCECGNASCTKRTIEPADCEEFLDTLIQKTVEAVEKECVPDKCAGEEKFGSSNPCEWQECRSQVIEAIRKFKGV